MAFAPSILFSYSSLSLWWHPLLNALVSAGVFGAIALVQIYRYRLVSNYATQKVKKGALLTNSALRPANRSKKDLLLRSLALATPLPSRMLCRSFISGSLFEVYPQGVGLPNGATRESSDEGRRDSIKQIAWKVNSLEVRLTAYYCGTTATASISTKKSGCARAETNTTVIAGALGTSGQAFWNASKPSCSGCPSTT